MALLNQPAGASSLWRDAAVSTTENILRSRALTGRVDYPVHLVGGVADPVIVSEVQAMVAAVRAERATVASLYDVVTTAPALWPALFGVPFG